MSRFKHTTSILAIAAAISSSFGEDGTMMSLPSDHLPLSCSGDGSIVMGTVGGTMWRWTAEEGVTYLGDFGNAGNPVISNDGNVVAGTGINVKTGKNEAGLWDLTEWDLLGTLGFSCDASASSSWGINGDGSTVVGLVWVDSCRAHAARWDDHGDTQDLGSTVPDRSSRANAISADSSRIIGWQDAETGFRQGAYWIDGVQTLITTSDGANVGEAQAVTPDGSVITGGSIVRDAYRWDAVSGNAVPIGNLPGFNFSSSGTDISDDGSRIVGFSGFGFDRDGFIWHEESGMEKLLDWANDNGIENMDGWTDIMIASVVSGDGNVIAGWGTGPDAFFQGFIMELSTTCHGDIVEDGTIDVNDLLALLFDWGPCDDCATDLDGSGTVDVDDLLTLLFAWGDC